MKDYERIKAQGGPFDTLIQSAADAAGVSYSLLHKQLFIESSFNPKAVSPTGPRGLGQFTRATGKAYGLVSDEDFFDPAKSVMAAARHMKDNLKRANGDELKALLMYNQGEGSLGRPQLSAFDRGDFSGISEEGLNYMHKMMDVAKSDRRDALTSFVKPEGSFEAPAGLTKEPQVQPKTDFSFSSMSAQGKPVVPQNKPWGQELMEATGSPEEPQQGLFTGLKDSAEAGIKNSPLGVAIRAATMNDNADFTQSFTMLRDVFNNPLENGRISDWTDEDYDKLRNSPLSPQFYDVVLRGYRKNFDNNLKLALENQALEEKAGRAGFGAQIAGGAVEMLGDPYTLMAPGRGAGSGIAGRIAGGAASGGAINALSESNSASISGREENIGMAIMGGVALGGTLNGLFGTRPGSMSWETNKGPDGDLADWNSNNQAGALKDMDDADIESILARHGEASEPNDYFATASRLEARERARQDGLDEDPTALPFRADADEIREGGIVDHMDVPWDADAARTMDGSIHSGGSPLNPKTVETFMDINPEVPRAQRGVRLGSLTEIGYMLNRSENPVVRALGNDLFRSPTGLETGAGGKFGSTASDIIERVRSQDNVVHNALDGHVRDVLKDPYWKNQPGTTATKREQVSRRVVEAMENTDGTGPKLTPPEQAMLKTLKDHMSNKWSMIENPAQFGNMNARSLLEGSRHEGSYFPQRYDRTAKLEVARKLGSLENLQEAIAKSWLTSYLKRPAVRARVDKMVTEKLEMELKGKKPTPEQIKAEVIRYAQNKAYGVSHSDNFSKSSFLEEHIKDTTGGLQANSYLEARNLFDSDVKIDLPDGSQFSVNDLREFDVLRVVPQYDRRVNGDIGIMGGTGKTTGELKAEIDKLNETAQRGKQKVEAQALVDALKLLTGRTRRDPEGVFANLIRSLNDVGFMTKNAYMGAQNVTESAMLFVKGQQSMLFKGVPLLKQWTTKGAKLEPDDIKQMHGMLFGKELDDLIRPERSDIIERLRESNVNETMAKAVGTIKHTTGEMAVRSPFTWLLRESSNYIADAGRQGMLIDLAHHTLNNAPSKNFSEGRLRSASVTPEQFKGVQDLIREQFRMDKNGKWRLRHPEKVANDPRAMDLWRLGDAVAHETVLRPHTLSFQASKVSGATGHAAGAMALQFKMFVLRSLNGRMVRGWMESTKNGQALDQTMAVMASLGLATAFYAARAQVAAYGMPERKRQEYLDTALSPSMLAYAALSRSSHVGAPLGVAGYISTPLGNDMGAMVRTSVLPREPDDNRSGRPMKHGALRSDPVQDFTSRALEQVPGAQVIGAGVQAAYSGAHLMNNNRGVDAQGHRTGLWNALRQFVPNDPVSQNLMMRLAEDQGVDRTR